MNEIMGKCGRRKNKQREWLEDNKFTGFDNMLMILLRL